MTAQPDPQHAGARIERIVRGVAAMAVAEADAGGIVVLEDWTPEGELVCEWLVRELGDARVWRAGSLASNVHAAAAGPDRLAAALRAAEARRALVAHPANRTALLLGGRLPFCDLLPLGDVWASQVQRLTGSWSGAAPTEALASRAGGIAGLDAALARMLDERGGPDALAALEPDVAGEVRARYDRGRWFRLRYRLVPKLGTRTLGIDLFD